MVITSFSFLGLIAMAFVVAAICAAIVNAGRANGWGWKVVFGVIVLLVALGTKLSSHNRSHDTVLMEHSPWSFAVPSERIVPMTSQQYTPQGGHSFVNYSRRTSWGAGLGFMILPVIGFLTFAAVRRYRRDVGAGGARGLAGVGVGSLALVAVFGFVFSVRESRTSTPTPTPLPVAVQELPSAEHSRSASEPSSTPQEPLDELWDRLNQPKIQLTETTPDSPANPSPGEPASAGGSPADPETPSTASPPITIATHEPATPAPRPAWVASPPNFAGAVRRVVVQAGPYSSLHECHDALQQEMRAAVAAHLRDVVQEATADPHADIPELEWLGIGNSLITREFLVDQYVEEGEASFGPTKTVWGLLEFSEPVNHNLVSAWKSYARRDRITSTALVAGGVLTLIGGAFALLSLDTWTRGYYTKRLFLGVPAAIIGLLFCVALFLEKIW